MLKQLLFLSLFIYQYNYAQNTSIEIVGEVLNTNSVGIEHTHVLNLSSKLGTVTTSNGKFRIRVKEGDWIQVSNLQYQQKKIKITKSDIQNKVAVVYLLLKVNELNEVVIKKKLSGYLDFDRLKSIKSTKGKIDKTYYNFSNLNMRIKPKVYTKADAIYHTDPTIRNAPVKIVNATIPDRHLMQKRNRRARIKFKSNFPKYLVALFGERYFTEHLKIPNDHYYRFIDYCSNSGIEELYKNDKHLDLLKVLLKESQTYLLQLEKKQ